MCQESRHKRNITPIFIHSLFRAGSTYVFHVFRRSSAGYYCFQEALHEATINANSDPERLIAEYGSSTVQELRHPDIGLPYFTELYKIWPVWKDMLPECALYDSYFALPDHGTRDIGIDFWNVLIDAAKGRPVFQECRTAGRIGTIKHLIGGYHIYLWRNPWDQWWSYKVVKYFNIVNRMIINASHVPPSVDLLRDKLGFKKISAKNFQQDFEYFESTPISAEESYLIFYMLWCLGLLQGLRYADELINIDKLSDSYDYRHELQIRLANAGIHGIDFNDCHIPQAQYFDEDRTFFKPLENDVHQMLLDSGWSQDDIDQVLECRYEFQPACWDYPLESHNPIEMAEHLRRTRTLVRQLENDIAISLRRDSWRLSKPLQWFIRKFLS